MMFIFSGRRGVHCWVADETARKLDNTGRAAVAEYISLIVGTKKVMIPTLFTHPLYNDAYEVIMESEEIDSLVIEQKWLEEENWEEILSFCRDEEWKNILRDRFSSVNSAKTRWTYLKLTFDPSYRLKNPDKTTESPPPIMKNFLKEVVLQYTHPRLDVNVSTGTNHLLKSPFCIHPKTGKIAVPLDCGIISQFNPEDVPTLTKIMEEMQTQKSKENSTTESFLNNCSLKPYLDTFNTFVETAVN